MLDMDKVLELIESALDKEREDNSALMLRIAKRAIMADKMGPSKKVVPAPKKAPAKTASENSGGEGVIAAITAAVTMMMDGAPFRVHSVTRSQGIANAWEMVAIQEQNNNF